MKRFMATVAAAALLAGMSVASAQNAPANTDSRKSDKTAQQSMQQPAPKAKKASKQHASVKSHRKMRETTGAGHEGSIGGPQNDPSIHQSFGRDSRGTPKGNGQN
jgi:Ni/Co efflux regulator RcnB